LRLHPRVDVLVGSADCLLVQSGFLAGNHGNDVRHSEEQKLAVARRVGRDRLDGWMGRHSELVQ